MLVESQEQLKKLQDELLLANDPIVIDTETSFVERYQDRWLLGVSLYVNYEAYYIPVNHQPSVEGLIVNNIKMEPDFFSGIKVPLIFHNALFDLSVLERAGFTIPDVPVICTMMWSHIVNEDYLAGHELSAVSKRYVDKESVKETFLKGRLKGFGWEQTPPSVMGVYACQDAILPFAIYNVLKPLMVGMEEYWDREFKITKIMMKMIKKGVLVNRATCRELEIECEKKIDSLIKEIGFDPAKLSISRKKLFDPPPVGLGLRKTHRTPTGLAQINDDFLAQCEHPITNLIQQHNHVKKELTSYYRPYLRLSDDDGHIHAGFKQHGTKTGRWSCADPNLHQIPRKGEIKELFSAEKNKELWEIDYNNIEWKMAAVYSQDPTLLRFFNNNEDMHMYVANKLVISRQDAKIGGFTYLFAGGHNAIMTQLGIAEEPAREFIIGMKELFPSLEAAKKRATKTAEANGYIKIWTGRKRHFNDKRQCYTAFNFLTQGGSFEIVKSSMLLLDAAGFDIRNCVHDSIWLMVDNEDQVKEAEHIMSDWTTESFGLNFSVESKRLG